MNAELLENLGLTKSEIKVYLAILELTRASASAIADKSGVYRKNTYDALNRLIKKGLVSFSKVEAKRIFQATDPQKLLDFLEIRKNEIKSIMPELKMIYHSPPRDDEVAVFRGRNGVKTVFEDILKSKADYDKFGAGEKFMQILPYYQPIYQKKKAMNRIRCRAVYSENERDEEFVKTFIGKVRFLPKEFVNPSTTIIYGRKVAIIIWKENPLGIVINSNEVADSYRYYFETLWASAKK